MVQLTLDGWPYQLEYYAHRDNMILCLTRVVNGKTKYILRAEQILQYLAHPPTGVTVFEIPTWIKFPQLPGQLTEGSEGLRKQVRDEELLRTDEFRTSLSLPNSNQNFNLPPGWNWG